MKVNKVLALSLAGAFAAAPLSVMAASDVPDTYFYVGGSVAQHYFDLTGRDHGEPERVSNITLPGAQIGWRFSPNWSVDGRWQRNGFGLKHSGNKGQMNFSTLTARYHFNNTSLLGFEPYVGPSVGVENFHHHGGPHYKDRRTMVGFDMGAQTMLTNFLALEVGARTYVRGHAHKTHDTKHAYESQIYTGLNFLFGASSATAAPAPAPAPAPVDGDADGDGVPDSLDKCPNTPAGAVVDADGCQKMLTEDVNVTLRVNFGFDDATVPQSDYSRIGEVADFAKKYPSSDITLDGYTDSTGAAAYNQTLSKKRANAVKGVLVDSFGVDAGRIAADGHGEANPVASNDTREGRAENRRVEAVIKAQKEKPQFEK